MINIYKNHSPIFLHNLFFLLESFKSLCKVVEINVVVISSVLKESWDIRTWNVLEGYLRSVAT